MSTNSERIAANNTRLSALVETAESLPDAGSGGGAVETCEVTIGGAIRLCYVTRYVDGEIVNNRYINADLPSPITDVVVGSALIIMTSVLGLPAEHCEIIQSTVINDEMTGIAWYVMAYSVVG